MRIYEIILLRLAETMLDVVIKATLPMIIIAETSKRGVIGSWANKLPNIKAISGLT